MFIHVFTSFVHLFSFSFILFCFILVLLHITTSLIFGSPLFFFVFYGDVEVARAVFLGAVALGCLDGGRYDPSVCSTVRTACPRPRIARTQRGVTRARR